jgi:hypothetical protein
MEFTDAIATARNAAEWHDTISFIVDERELGFGFQVYTYNVREYDEPAKDCPLAATVYPDGSIELEPEYER